jgi:hypothetical protein
MELLKRSADFDSVEALMALGSIHEEGITGSVDILEAFTKYDEAVNVTVTEAERYPSLPDERPKEKRAALVKNHLDEILTAGRAIVEGKAAETPTVKRALLIAAELGFGDAAAILDALSSRARSEL